MGPPRGGHPSGHCEVSWGCQWESGIGPSDGNVPFWVTANEIHACCGSNWLVKPVILVKFANCGLEVWGGCWHMLSDCCPKGQLCRDSHRLGSTRLYSDYNSTSQSLGFWMCACKCLQKLWYEHVKTHIQEPVLPHDFASERVFS